MVRRLGLAAAAAAALMACSGCVGPTLTDDAMRSQASRSAESAVSEIETIKLAVNSAQR